MGDPKKTKKKYSKPAHLWQKERIEQEQLLLNEYGLVNKREIWKAGSLLRAYSRQAKRLIAFKGTSQSELESKQLLDKLVGLGLIKNKTLESVLDINLRDVLARRLQTVVFKKNMARSINQARQMITHSHIVVGGKRVTAPSYMVSVNEESNIIFSEKSGFSKADHPERSEVKNDKK